VASLLWSDVNDFSSFDANASLINFDFGNSMNDPESAGDPQLFSPPPSASNAGSVDGQVFDWVLPLQIQSGLFKSSLLGSELIHNSLR
jgi:hypothetical protein